MFAVLGFDLRVDLAGEPLAAQGLGGGLDQLRSTVLRVGDALHVPGGFELVDELAHRRTGHAGAGDEDARPRSLRLDVGDDRAVLWSQTLLAARVVSVEQL